jgi:hypothetical protein
MRPEPEFVDLFQESRNRFPARRACTTTLCSGWPDYIGLRNRSLESILGLLKRLKNRAQDSYTIEEEILSTKCSCNHSTNFYRKNAGVFPLWFLRIRHAAQPADARSFLFLPCAPPMEEKSR